MLRILLLLILLLPVLPCSGEEIDSKTERRKLLFNAINKQKQIDSETINRCFNTCEILANIDSNNALSCVRECNDREREQRKDSWNSGVNALNNTGLLILLKKFL